MERKKKTDFLSGEKQHSAFSTPKALTQKQQVSQNIMHVGLRKGCLICVDISMGATWLRAETTGHCHGAEKEGLERIHIFCR